MKGKWRCEFPKMGALTPCRTVSGGKWTFLFRGVDPASTLWFVMGEPPESPAHKRFGIAKTPFQAHVCSNSCIRIQAGQRSRQVAEGDASGATVQETCGR